MQIAERPTLELLTGSDDEETAADLRFRLGNRADATFDHNQRFLKYFIEDFLHSTNQDFVVRARNDPDWAESRIMEYFGILKQRVGRKEIRPDSTHNFRDPIKVLCDTNKVKDLDWKLLDKVLPARRRKAFQGEAPPKETLRTLASYDDSRMKPIITTLVSGGFRKGIFDWNVKVGDLEPVYLDGKLVCGKLTVYRDEPEQYSTRVSLECYNFWLDYFRQRRRAKEPITADSPMLRDNWIWEEKGKGDPKNPKPLASNGVKSLLEDAWASFPGLRVKKPGSKNFNYKATHFGRKYFETACKRAGILDWQIAILRGDILPTALGYEGFTEEEKTSWYLKATQELTIFEDSAIANNEQVETLQKQVADLNSKVNQTTFELQKTNEALQETREIANTVNIAVEALLGENLDFKGSLEEYYKLPKKMQTRERLAEIMESVRTNRLNVWKNPNEDKAYKFVIEQKKKPDISLDYEKS